MGAMVKVDSSIYRVKMRGFFITDGGPGGKEVRQVGNRVFQIIDG